MNGTAATTANSRSASAVLTLAWRFATLWSQGLPVFPILILLTVLFLAVCANVLAPHNPEVGVLGDRFRPPAWQSTGTVDHLLGTDHLGRDVLSRLLFGARISVLVGLTDVLGAATAGTARGCRSVYLGRWSA